MSKFFHVWCTQKNKNPALYFFIAFLSHSNLCDHIISGQIHVLRKKKYYFPCNFPGKKIVIEKISSTYEMLLVGLLKIQKYPLHLVGPPAATICSLQRFCIRLFVEENFVPHALEEKYYWPPMGLLAWYRPHTVSFLSPTFILVLKNSGHNLINMALSNIGGMFWRDHTEKVTYVN